MAERRRGKERKMRREERRGEERGEKKKMDASSSKFEIKDGACKICVPVCVIVCAYIQYIQWFRLTVCV